MRIISVDQCLPGMKVAKAIYNNKGQVLIQDEVLLTERMISRLHELEVPYIYIEDEKTADIVIQEPVSQETHLKAINTIRDTFKNIMKDGSLNQLVDDPDLAREFKSIVKDILYDIKNQQQIMSLLVDVHSSDLYTFQHSLNVTLYSLALASTQPYNERQLIEIGVGAILHDVGKCTVPLSILNKTGPLTDEEFSVIKEHTTNGFNALRQIKELSLLSAHCAYQHHERIDGSGYPRGLTGADIHEYSKIIAIADVFDALTTKRSYRKAMLPHVAMEVIESGAGTLFDTNLVEQFKRTIAIYPLGMSLRLSNGMIGVVVDHNRNQLGRPIVRVLKNEFGIDLKSPKELDLSKHSSIYIEACHV